MERWVPISGFEDAYEVSDLGRIRSVDRPVTHKHGGIAIRKGRILKPGLNKQGYPRVVLSKKCLPFYVCIHRVVAMHFLPNPLHLTEVNHINSDRADASAHNLEWCTHIENMRHAVKAGSFHAATNYRRSKRFQRAMKEISNGQS